MVSYWCCFTDPAGDYESLAGSKSTYIASVLAPVGCMHVVIQGDPNCAIFCFPQQAPVAKIATRIAP